MTPEGLLGQRVTLTLDRIGTAGGFLAVEPRPGAATVFLPARELPADAAVGQALEVFVYRDSEEQIVATTATPRLTIGEVAFLQVTARADHGAYVDWGLGKELFVPYAEQTRELEVGAWHPFGLYLDKSERLGELMARPTPESDLVVPMYPEVPDLVAWATRALYARLMKAGVHVHEWTGCVLHAKTALVDDWATTGSYNMDARSWRYNLEANLTPRPLGGRCLSELHAELAGERAGGLADLREQVGHDDRVRIDDQIAQHRRRGVVTLGASLEDVTQSLSSCGDFRKRRCGHRTGRIRVLSRSRKAESLAQCRLRGCAMSPRTRFQRAGLQQTEPGQRSPAALRAVR